MKKYLYSLVFIALLFSTCIASAQGQRSIEVISSDTIHLKAISFEYKISIAEEQSSVFSALAAFGGKENADESKYAPQMDSLEKILKDNHYKYTYSVDNKYALGKHVKPSAVIIVLSSETELNTLCKKLSPMQSLKGKVQNITYEKPDPYLEAMFGRLYTAAAAQASQMARISGASLGKVITITEIATASAGPSASPYESMMTDMMKKMPFGGLYELTESLSSPYCRKMSFRFELN